MPAGTMIGHGKARDERAPRAGGAPRAPADAARLTLPGRTTRLLALAALLGCLLALLGSVPARAAEPQCSNPASEPPPLGEEELAGPGSGEIGGPVTNPIDSKFLFKFGATSFWLEPWRAYLDTWPVSRLADSLGINAKSLPEAVARLLRDSGFKYVRREIPWGAIEYGPGEPARLKEANRLSIEADFSAMRNCGLRPLILLNANSGAPGPSRRFKVDVLENAPPGATSVRLKLLQPGQEILPGKTGFDELAFGGSPDVLITSAEELEPGEFKVTLARPIPRGVGEGQGLLAGTLYPLSTLQYAPFASPTLPNGSPNPEFQETMNGWLSYVATVSKLAQEYFGPGGYDLEIWNELTFGSQFLDWENYYTPPTGTKNKSVAHAIRRDLLRETIAYVHNSANGLSAGGISDGFASQTPFPSGSEAPLGLTALSKHLYAGPKWYPAEYKTNREPLNAKRQRDTTRKSKVPLFIPHYRAYFPEFMMSGLTTETIIRDLAPFPNKIEKTVHGRFVGPPGGEPVQKWMTEYNLAIKDPERAEEPSEGIEEEEVPEEEPPPACEEGLELQCEEPERSEQEQREIEEHDKHIHRPVGPDGVTEEHVKLTPADRMHFEAKVALRSLVAMVSKGMARDYFYKGTQGALSLIGNKFWEALEAHPETYPGETLGGPTMQGLQNLLAQFQGPITQGEVKPLKLTSIVQEGNHAQFTGDGSEAHPTQYDREVLAVFPYQASATRYVIPVYVMTKDLLTLYKPPAGNGKEPPVVTNPTAFDLPNETFRFGLSGFSQSACAPTVKAYDPLRNIDTPAKLLLQQGEQDLLEMAATDYPRLLIIETPSSC